MIDNLSAMIVMPGRADSDTILSGDDVMAEEYLYYLEPLGIDARNPFSNRWTRVHTRHAYARDLGSGCAGSPWKIKGRVLDSRLNMVLQFEKPLFHSYYTEQP